MKLFAAATNLMVSLLLLHINIVGVVTCSENSTRRLVTCIIGYIFFNSFYYHITQHSSIAATSETQYKKKNLKKFNKMLLILVEKYAANEQLTVNVTSNFPQYCYNYLDW